MTASVLWLTALLQSAPAAEVTVVAGETSLAAVARRALGDELAAPELRALNQLTSDVVRAGDRLKVPGPERKASLTAIQSARTAVARADAPETRLEGDRLLGAAEAHFRGARYAEAAAAADVAWQYASSRQQARPSSFQVSVNAQGSTEVKATQGESIRVESESVTHELKEGERAQATPGKPLQVVAAVGAPTGMTATVEYADGTATTQATPLQQQKPSGLPTPKVLGPSNKQVLKVNRPRGTLLRWEAVPGADGYELSLRNLAEASASKTLWVASPAAKLDLGSGIYEWTVKARGGGKSSAPTARRTFTVEREN